MAEDPVSGYAEAFLAVVSAEGGPSNIEDELYAIAEAVRSSEELRSTLADPGIPLGRRLEVLEDLLAARISSTARALVAMVVVTGRSSDLPAVVSAFIEYSAASRNKSVATVRSAVDLTPAQRERLTSAINTATGKNVEIRVVQDESVLGGLVTEIGDDIIDGSVRRRLSQLRESFR